jgi:hypothetical protein
MKIIRRHKSDWNGIHHCEYAYTCAHATGHQQIIYVTLFDFRSLQHWPHMFIFRLMKLMLTDIQPQRRVLLSRQKIHLPTVKDLSRRLSYIIACIMCIQTPRILESFWNTKMKEKRKRCNKAMRCIENHIGTLIFDVIAKIWLGKALKECRKLCRSAAHDCLWARLANWSTHCCMPNSIMRSLSRNHLTDCVLYCPT